ncbi:hypothetical protein Pan216_48140 [Planctomycetes bacterium Pan216]|uniref:Putative restriction endonuclease domain-containing protein n=1 Tax=Kolteria novifilia TaxID=2527975 RepID=A0A518BAJ9_9BACT|nr:hypothetical protein Pan216_48140 [Planctomycetes bacterium Pan216]
MSTTIDISTTATEPEVRRWTREEYHQMADLGLFENQRVQLIDGVILRMSPHGARHAAAIRLAVYTLEEVFGRGSVTTQLPIALAEDCEPEPDVAVIPGTIREYTSKLPTTAHFVLEASASTLAYDRREKAGLYARAGIPDYWVLNLLDNKLEIHREPIADADHPFGHRYAKTTILEKKDLVAPLAAPETPIAVKDLLP